MYHYALEYHFDPDSNGYQHSLQLYTDEHTNASFEALRKRFFEIDSWIYWNTSIGRFEHSKWIKYGWQFQRKEDAMLVKITFG